jgi:hypothetical protein
MSARIKKAPEAQEIPNRVDDARRCRFTSAHGNRCANPLLSHTTGFCIIHQRQAQQISEEQACLNSEILFKGCTLFNTPEEIRTFLAKLLILITQKRISHADGLLLTYACSLMLQTMPSRKKPSPPQYISTWEYPRDNSSARAGAVPSGSGKA